MRDDTKYGATLSRIYKNPIVAEPETFEHFERIGPARTNKVLSIASRGPIGQAMGTRACHLNQSELAYIIGLLAWRYVFWFAAP